MIERMPRPLCLSLPTFLVGALILTFLARPPEAAAQFGSGGIDHLPALGEASVDDLSPAAEQRLGDQIFQEFLRTGVVYDDPETADYLARQAKLLLGAAVSLGHTEADRPFEFFVVRDPTLNAFALPGGYIGVHTGLITATPRESELMSVLAHEIGHVTQRHIARMFGQQRQSSAIMITAAVLAALAARASPDAAMGMLSLGQTVALRDQLAFSRDAEREADRIGLQILAQSGFDPRGMASMFDRLGQAGRLYENNAPAYLRTHPMTGDRVADIQGRLQTDPMLRPQRASMGGGPESVQFLWIRAKLTALSDTRVDGLRAARARFEDQLKEAANKTPGDRGPLHFGLAWAALTQRDFPAAREALALARSEAAQAGTLEAVLPLLVHHALRLALVANDAQDIKESLQMADPALMQHRAVARAAVELRLAVAPPHDETALAARRITQQWPRDPQAWSLLGRVEAARGRQAAQHAAIAEQYALAGAYAAAVEQLTLARRAGDGDFITMSRIDARLTAMRAALQREQLERQQR